MNTENQYKAQIGLPYFQRNGISTVPPHGRVVYLPSDEEAQFVTCIMNSSLFFWHYSVFSDCEHINDGLVRQFPIPRAWQSVDWSALCEPLTNCLRRCSDRKTIQTRQGHTIVVDP